MTSERCGAPAATYYLFVQQKAESKMHLNLPYPLPIYFQSDASKPRPGLCSASSGKRLESKGDLKEAPSPFPSSPQKRVFVQAPLLGRSWEW